jgi:hypothetical protein
MSIRSNVNVGRISHLPAPELNWEKAMSGQEHNEPALLARRPVLNSESADEFGAMHQALVQEIKPRGFIEHMFVDDISYIVWEILRLRRCKPVVIDAAFRSALVHLLMQCLRQPAQLDYSVK